MAQVSQIFGLENPGELHFDNLSEGDESDEENRDDEIKKLLEEGLGNETFDYDSDGSSHNGTRSSNHNNCSFISNKDNSRLSMNGINSSVGKNDGLFKTPNRHGALDINMLPNKILGSSDEKETQGSSGSKRNTVEQNGHFKNSVYTNGGIEALAKNAIASSKSNGNGIAMQSQKNRENEEIEVTNPTISVLHKEHCPQNENDGLGSGIWLSAENNVEQMKTLCDFRERQIQRAEETIATLQKDKRALNHQIGLMKTEMVQIKSQNQDVEKFANLKEEEVNYLKTKIREAIEEYEQARRREIAAKENSDRLLSEIEKLQQEVKLLSSLGSSTQQAEIDDVVRQLREKHAKDIAAWQKVVVELEGQIRTYKRTQQLLHEESFTAMKESVQTQTEFSIEEEIERREKELAVHEFQEEFGGAGDAFIEELSNLNEREIVKRVRKEWATERDKISNYYRREIKIYQQKLASLPSELYEMWQKTQEELGLNKPAAIKPICKHAATLTEAKYTTVPKMYSEKSTTYDLPISDDEDIEAKEKSKIFKEESVQVNYAAVMANTYETMGNGNDENQVSIALDPSKKRLTTSTSGIDEKETSSVIVQTDETLETYKILASLIDSWAGEVAASKQRAESAETRSQSVEDELKSLNKRFKQLQKMAVSCRKEWKKQEDVLKQKYSDMKIHYVGMLKNLNEKLAQIDEGALEGTR